MILSERSEITDRLWPWMVGYLLRNCLLCLLVSASLSEKEEPLVVFAFLLLLSSELVRGGNYAW